MTSTKNWNFELPPFLPHTLSQNFPFYKAVTQTQPPSLPLISLTSFANKSWYRNSNRSKRDHFPINNIQTTPNGKLILYNYKYFKMRVMPYRKKLSLKVPQCNCQFNQIYYHLSFYCFFIINSSKTLTNYFQLLEFRFTTSTDHCKNQSNLLISGNKHRKFLKKIKQQK